MRVQRSRPRSSPMPMHLRRNLSIGEALRLQLHWVALGGKKWRCIFMTASRPAAYRYYDNRQALSLPLLEWAHVP